MVEKAAKVSKKLGYFRFCRLNGEYLVTNDVGEYAFLGSEDFEKFLDGKLKSGTQAHEELLRKGFLKDGVDSETFTERYRRRHDFLNYGPHLHIVIATLRCNETCVYCHASRKDMEQGDFDMSLSTAKKTVDVIFETTSPTIIIEFQGGEPLANFETLQFITEYAQEKNKEANKRLGVTLVTNLSLMTEERLKYLMDHNVMICTSLDGPEELHNRNRILKGGNAYSETVKWITRINEAYQERGLEKEVYHADALLTVSRNSLPHYKEIVDEYLKHGIHAIHIRFLNPFGLAAQSMEQIGYTPEEFLDFYTKALDYIIEMNLNGTDMLERTAAIFMSKVLTDEDPNFLDMRSPCGAGIGQLAYNYDGNVFTCDEGRMVYQMNDDIFLIGNVRTDTYQDMMRHGTLRALTVASCLDCLPGCSECVFKPYCGVCPIFNYIEQGDIFGQMPNNMRCKINKSILTYLFEKMKGNPTITEIFRRWTINKRPLLYLES